MKIVNLDDVTATAFDLGFDRFAGMDPVPIDEFDIGFFTESAEYANNTAPTLRQLAGYADHGFGTYTDKRDVLVVYQDDAEELATDAGFIDADMVWSPDLFEKLHDSWLHGVYDAVELAAEERPELIR